MAGNWDAWLELDGVKGESQRKGHEEQIEVLSFSWGGNNPASVGHGSGGGAGKVALSDFSIMKMTDATSTDLFQKMCSGKHYPKATLTMYKAGGDEALDYLKYTFEELFVTSINWSGSQGGDAIPTESVSFAFGKVTMDYKIQNPDGSAKGTVPGSWDVRTNTK